MFQKDKILFTWIVIVDGRIQFDTLHNITHI